MYFFNKYANACRLLRQSQLNLRNARIQSDLVTQPTVLLNVVSRGVRCPLALVIGA